MVRNRDGVLVVAVPARKDGGCAATTAVMIVPSTGVLYPGGSLAGDERADPRPPTASCGDEPVIRVAIDRDRCVGSGNCLFWAPGTFDLDDEGLSVVIDPAGDDEEAIQVAVEGCPTRAITISATEDRADHRPGDADVEDLGQPVRTERGTDADRPVR
jgi:ferredoxin